MSWQPDADAACSSTVQQPRVAGLGSYAVIAQEIGGHGSAVSRAYMYMSRRPLASLGAGPPAGIRLSLRGPDGGCVPRPDMQFQPWNLKLMMSPLRNSLDSERGGQQARW